MVEASITVLIRAGNERLGAGQTLPSWRGEGGAARCEVTGPENQDVYFLEYIEDFFWQNTT